MLTRQRCLAGRHRDACKQVADGGVVGSIKVVSQEMAVLVPGFHVDSLIGRGIGCQQATDDNWLKVLLTCERVGTLDLKFEVCHYPIVVAVVVHSGRQCPSITSRILHPFSHNVAQQEVAASVVVQFDVAQSVRRKGKCRGDPQYGHFKSRGYSAPTNRRGDDIQRRLMQEECLVAMCAPYCRSTFALHPQQWRVAPVV
eukprot:1177830-Prorocentrum_minimum.AAC.1